MKIGVSSYSYSGVMREMGIFKVIEHAKETGFSVIEIAGLPVPEGKDIIEFAEEVRAFCEKTGIEIGNYTIGADMLNGSGGNLGAEVERVCREVDIARALGSPSMRHDVCGGFARGIIPRGFEDALPVLAKGCMAVTEYAEQFGIKTSVENHGYFCQDSERVEKLINAVGHKNFGVLLDIGNFLCVDEEPAKAVGRLLPYTFHVHAKDFHTKKGYEPNPGEGWFRSRGGNYLRGAIVGHGDANAYQCVSMIKNSGYDGTLSIEFEGMEHPLKGITIGYKNLKRWVE